jgi:hypothetical protein
MGMYIVSGVLYFLPLSTLVAAWLGAAQSERESPRPKWRTFCFKSALFVASLATVTSMAFVFSWLHSGGSPHGMGPAPGVWQHLRPISNWTLIATIGLATSGKGKPRLLVYGSALAVILVETLVGILEMD